MNVAHSLLSTPRVIPGALQGPYPVLSNWHDFRVMSRALQMYADDVIEISPEL